MNAEQATVDVENIGGIDESHVAFEPGVTVLAGRNATNRTSLLLAMMTALGSADYSLKADADAGEVALTVDGDTYTRRLTRKNGSVVPEGDAYLGDSELADLFAFLLERNDARRAVERGDDLRELIMRPVDTGEIQRQIERLLDERRRIEDELDELDSLGDEQARLEQERARLESRVEETREELRETTDEIDAADSDLDDARDEKAALEERLGELQTVRSRLDDVRYELETERESLDSLREERESLSAEADELSAVPAGELAELDQRLERLRGTKSALDATVSELQGVVQFNEETLEEGDAALLGALDGGDGDGDGAVTDQLLGDSQTVTCWTCGSDVERERIDETLERLRDLQREKVEERRDIAAEIDELTDERREYENQQRRREELQRSLDEVTDEIERRESRVEELTATRNDLRDEVESLESSVEEQRDEAYGEILDLHKEANQLEFELGRHEDDLEEVEARLAEIDDRLDDRDDLAARREAVQEELTELRTRVERVESEAVDAFNTHMERVLDILDYTNIARIWIERTQREVREGRKKVARSFFDLHVVRGTDDGATYEDTVDHLSESEREVVGLVFALAGYLVHEVYESVPFVLLDSLEAIDAERIATLVEYLSEYADYLVVALLPEDAAALSEEYARVSDI